MLGNDSSSAWYLHTGRNRRSLTPGSVNYKGLVGWKMTLKELALRMRC
jgi:hypothetical protein